MIAPRPAEHGGKVGVGKRGLRQAPAALEPGVGELGAAHRVRAKQRNHVRDAQACGAREHGRRLRPRETGIGQRRRVVAGRLVHAAENKVEVERARARRQARAHAAWAGGGRRREVNGQRRRQHPVVRARYLRGKRRARGVKSSDNGLQALVAVVAKVDAAVGPAAAAAPAAKRVVENEADHRAVRVAERARRARLAVRRRHAQV